MTNRIVSVQQQWWGNSADGSGIISGYSELYSLYRVRSQHLLNTLLTPSPVSPRPRHRYSYVLHPYKCFIVMSRQRCGGEAEEVNNGNLLQLMVGFKLYTPDQRDGDSELWCWELKTIITLYIILVTRPVEYEDGWHCVCMSHYLDSYRVKRQRGYRLTMNYAILHHAR